jgi:hypothetical protein
MNDRELYSIQEARELLGGISRNSIYELLRSGRLASFWAAGDSSPRRRSRT